MYKTYFKQYLHSQTYSVIEKDPIYIKLITLLSNNLSSNTYLDVEELLHAEILFKLEVGFKNGYSCNLSTK